VLSGEEAVAREAATAEQLATNMLRGAAYAWLTSRQARYLGEVAVREAGGSGRLFDNGILVTNGYASPGVRWFPVTGARLGDYRLFVFPMVGEGQGLLLPVPRPEEIRAVSASERRALLTAFKSIILDREHYDTGDFESARDLYLEFHALWGTLEAAARNSLFADEPAEPAESLVDHQLWWNGAWFAGMEDFVYRAYRVFGHGGRRSDAWKLLYASTHEPSARERMSRAERGRTRGAVCFVHPDGRQEARRFGQGIVGELLLGSARHAVADAA
jgi:hypothetical protein